MIPHNVEITIEVLAQNQAKVEYALLCLKKSFHYQLSISSGFNFQNLIYH